MLQNNACACNLVAHILDAVCGRFQSYIESSWRLEEAQWAANCTTSSFDATGIPFPVPTSSVDVPSWALLTNTGPSRDPSAASAAAVIVSGANINTNLGSATAVPNTGINNGLTFSYGHNPLNNTVNDNPYNWDVNYSTGVSAYAVVLGTFSSSSSFITLSH
jgi:hypothetical protein